MWLNFVQIVDTCLLFPAFTFRTFKTAGPDRSHPKLKPRSGRQFANRHLNNLREFQPDCLFSTKQCRPFLLPFPAWWSFRRRDLRGRRRTSLRLNVGSWQVFLEYWSALEIWHIYFALRGHMSMRHLRMCVKYGVGLVLRLGLGYIRVNLRGRVGIGVRFGVVAHRPSVSC